MSPSFTRNTAVISRLPITALRLFVLFVGAMFAATAVVADDDDDKEKETKKGPKGGIFEGKWVNAKRRTSGPMRCELKAGDEGEWSGKFEGTFQGSPFKYDVTFTAKTTGVKTDFKGDAEIDGDAYKWTGSLKGDAFNVKYRSGHGNNGDFTLKRSAKKPDPKKKSPKKGVIAE